MDDSDLPEGWHSLFVNANDGSNEGIAHKDWDGWNFPDGLVVFRKFEKLPDLSMRMKCHPLN